MDKLTQIKRWIQQINACNPFTTGQKIEIVQMVKEIEENEPAILEDLYNNEGMTEQQIMEVVVVKMFEKYMIEIVQSLIAETFPDDTDIQYHVLQFCAFNHSVIYEAFNSPLIPVPPAMTDY